MTVANSDGTSTFAFKETKKLNADVDEFGFDEPALRDGAVISSVNLFVTANGISFKEVKPRGLVAMRQAGGVCGTVVINPTSGVPRPSTWAMGLIGFTVMGFMGFKRNRMSRHAHVHVGHSIGDSMTSAVPVSLPRHFCPRYTCRSSSCGRQGTDLGWAALFIPGSIYVLRGPFTSLRHSGDFS